MALYPLATKTSMAQLLRSKGYELPKIKDTQFSRLTHSFFLRWVDLNGYGHQAYYTAACGKPYLEVDHKPVKLTMAEVTILGLVLDTDADKKADKKKEEAK